MGAKRTAGAAGALAVSAALVLCGVLGGCALLAGPQPYRAPDPSEIARASVEEALQPIAFDRNDDIFFVARAAAAAVETTSLRLIAIEEDSAGALGEPFGALSFQYPGSDVTDDAGITRVVGPFCFRVDFDYYGAESVDGVVVTEQFDCPAEAVAITPPPDETVYPVIAENAREAVRSVLEEVAAGGGSPSTDDIAERIRARLVPPASEFQTLAEPDVAENSGDIGVAMSAAGDCVLVSLVDGAVTDVYPPAVLLQPGELGCAGSTAIADPDLLRSPH
jgi:hypothetical protein